MSNATEILAKYTSGEYTAEEANEKLKEAGIDSFHIVPGKNELTEEDIKATTVGETAAEANGFGLLDTGTGTMEKVHVVNGKLDYAVNQVNDDGTTNMIAYVLIGGKTYEVKGDTLV